MSQSESRSNKSEASGLAVLVTGATGFLGSHLCEELEELGYQVHSLSRKPNSEKKQDRHHVCDLVSPTNLTEILMREKWYAIFHLAGLISYSPSDGPAMEAINVRATSALLECAIKCCPQAKFLYCSSVVAVGSNQYVDAAPINEDFPWDSSLEHIGYVRTKKKAEDLVRAAGRCGKIPTASICPSNIFGARDGLKRSRQSQIKAANGRMKFYPQGGVSVVHVKVVVDAFVKLLETSVSNVMTVAGADDDDDDNVWKGSRWLVTGENVTVRDMLTLFSKEGGNEKYAPWLGLPNWLLGIICWVSERLGSQSMTMEKFLLASRYNWYDGSRARTRFKLCETSAREAVAESVRWMRGEGIVKAREG